jgi:hypothetical protein
MLSLIWSRYARSISARAKFTPSLKSMLINNPASSVGDTDQAVFAYPSFPIRIGKKNQIRINPNKMLNTVSLKIFFP